MSTTVDTSVQRTTRRISASAVVVWFCWLGMVACAAIFISRHEVRIPRHDEWESFAQLVGEKPITLSWLWAFQNEHRIPLQRVLYIASIRAAGLRFSGGMYLNLAMLATAAGLFMVAARRLRGRWSLVDVAFPALLLHLGQYENYLNSFQIQFSVCALITSALGVQMLLIRAVPGWRQLALIGGTMLLLPLDGGTTLVFVPPLLLWMGGVVVALRRCVSPDRGKAIAIALVVLLLCAALCFAYFQGFAATTAPAFSLSGLLRAIVEFASTAWGHGFVTQSWKISGTLMLGVGAITAVSLWRRLRQDRDSRMRTLGLIAVFAGFGLMVGSIAYGRGMIAPLWGTSPRYAGLLAPCLALCLLILCTDRARWLRLAGMAAAGIVVLGLYPNSIIGLKSAHAMDRQYATLKGDVAAGLPLEAVAMRSASFVYVSNIPHTQECLLTLQQYRMGPFALRSAPLPRGAEGLVAVPLTATPDANGMRYDPATQTWQSTGPDPYLVFSLPEAGRIAGIHLVAEINRPEGAGQLDPNARTDYFWAGDSPQPFDALERCISVRYPIGQEFDQQIWIYDQVRRFRVDPDSWPCRFTIRRIDLLLTPADAEHLRQPLSVLPLRHGAE